MRYYTIGIEDHYAWANLVSVTTSGGDVVVLDSRRVELLEANLPVSPYHHDTLRLPSADAERLVHDVKTSANHRAESALASVVADLAPASCRGIAIRIPPLAELPATVAEVHANAWITNRADGMIYHQAITDAATRLGLTVFHFDKNDVLELAALACGKAVHDLETDLRDLRRTVGRPWRRGQIVACAGAIVAQAPHSPHVPAAQGTGGANSTI